MTSQSERAGNEQGAPPVLWVVVPCFNEAEALASTAHTLNKLLETLVDERDVAPESRLLFVDDGSTDATWDVIESLYDASAGLGTTDHSSTGHSNAIGHSSVYDHRSTADQGGIRTLGLRLAHNTGQQCALFAGLMCALEGGCDCAVTIDADLQDDPEAIKEMLERAREGAEVVYGVRIDRSSDAVFKRVSAKLFYKLMKLLGIETVANSADFRLMGRRSLTVLAEFCETNLFLRGIVPTLGFPSAEVAYTRRARRNGTSKYSLGKMISLALGGITSSSIQPVRLVTITGIVVVLVSLGMIIYALASAFLGSVVAGWTSLMISIWMVGGLIMMSLGIVGEYVARTYLEAKRRPRYVVIDKRL